MSAIYKLVIVVLLLYRTLSGLNAIPLLLIDRHKSADSANTTIASANTNTSIIATSGRVGSLPADSALSPFQEWLPTNGSSVNYDNANRGRIDKAESIDANDRNDDGHQNRSHHHYHYNHRRCRRRRRRRRSVDSNALDAASVDNASNNQITTTTITTTTTNAHKQPNPTATDFSSNRATPAKRANYFHYDVKVAPASASIITNDLPPPFNALATLTATTTTTSKLMTPAVSDRVEETLASSLPIQDDVESDDDDDHNPINNSNVERFLLKYDSDDGKKCLLDDIKEYFKWWSHANGTLSEDPLNDTSINSYIDLSFRNIRSDSQLYAKARASTYLRDRQILAFSAAQNNLTTAPYRTLTLMNSTLRYLTLKGNQFASKTRKNELNRIMNDTSRHPDEFNNNKENGETCDDCEYTTTETDTDTEEGIAWATFPPLPALLELDISHCQIEYVKKAAFKNLTGLRRLFISHNKMLTIPSDTFHHIMALEYLDMSFTNVLNIDYHLPLPTLDFVINLIYGVTIHPTTFKYLPKLVYLDLSHTKLTRNSAVAFTHLAERLKYLSLCYTAFPMIGNALFKNTVLVGLDLSGNPYAAHNIIDDAFEGVAGTLKYLYFHDSNIKDLAWLKCLENLRVLGLSGNNINSVALETFRSLRRLHLLDLSSNHVGNWYNRAFSHNKNLRVLNLRDNNINIINLEMLKDFQTLDYLSLGDNNFVCDCLLRDLVDIAAANNNEADCLSNIVQDARQILVDNMARVADYLPTNVTQFAMDRYRALKAAAATIDFELPDIDISSMLLQRYMPQLHTSYLNMKSYSQRRQKMRFVTRYIDAFKAAKTNCRPAESVVVYDKLNRSTLKFQLLDYKEEHYWCFNETERMNFVQLNCESRNFDMDIAQQLNTITKYVVGAVSALLGLSLISVLVYLKRWHIHYYYSSLKSAALLSVATKETVDKFNTLADHDPSLVYDIFISYCQTDREWVLEELLPNVEEAGHISICMHERDFQIGLTILDNIISCMDRSRALMLIISKKFLLSHWCQFEMHLAQHRIFEVSKEHLIIVFLEDIPRSKRPKTLQYLMGVKTYIKWPAGKGNKQPKPEERKLFWRRLKRSLENIGTSCPESRA